MPDTQGSQSITNTTRAWLLELRAVQQWIETHPILLAGAAILLPSVSIYHYTISERVPLSVASPGLISALPSVLAAIAFLTIGLCALPILPASLMLDGAVREQSGRLRVLPRGSKERRQYALRWMGAFALPGGILALSLFASVSWLPESHWTVPLGIGLASAVFTGIVTITRRAHGLVATFDSVLFSLLMSLLQMLLAITVMKLAIRQIDPSAPDIVVFGALMGSSLILASVQVLVVVVIEETSQHAGFVTLAFVAALGAIALACIVPTTGAALAGSVIRASAAGNAECVQLRLSIEAKDFSDIVSAPNVSRDTVKLRLLSNTDGMYLVRKAEEPNETVYRIPSDKVVALTPCVTQETSAGSKAAH